MKYFLPLAGFAFAAPLNTEPSTTVPLATVTDIPSPYLPATQSFNFIVKCDSKVSQENCEAAEYY